MFEKAVDIALAATDDLAILARMAESDIRHFYIGAQLDGIDVRGKDLRGLNFSSASFKGIKADHRTLVDEQYAVFLFGESTITWSSFIERGRIIPLDGKYFDAQMALIGCHIRLGNLRLAWEYFIFVTTHGSFDMEFRSYVIHALLARNFDIGQIKPYFFPLLEDVDDRDLFLRLVRAWIQAGGSVQQIYEPISEWLRGNFDTKEGLELLIIWLTNNKDPKPFTEYIIESCAMEPTNLRTGVIYELWIKHGGDLSAIGQYAWSWMIANQDARIAPNVLGAMLRGTACEPNCLSETRFWLKRFGTRWNAQIVLMAWIKSCHNYLSVLPFLLNWLDVHGENSGASAIYLPWLRRAGADDHLRTHFVKWIEKNMHKKDARDMMVAWMSCGGDFGAIEGGIVHFINKFHKRASTDKLIVIAIQYMKDLSQIDDAIHAFVFKFQNKRPGKRVLHELRIRNSGSPLLDAARL